ncbi:DUF3231 family protein [Rossellomorea arthrocnemi]|jgi:hypothetical protein|uniref:DUF3231 family protein n=1 Tax=Rossellomorea arthrocnemi TaxID=2769542 RepID=UPI00191B6E99|nr:DUF3231 family protein [Rossellomorea arthrocnemi]
MVDNHKANLTASEIASLWTAYMNNSMSCCFLIHFLKTVEDQRIHAVVERAFSIADNDLSTLREIFEKEDLPAPTGFSEQDVNVSAPRLYSDSFILFYIHQMAKVGMLGYSGMISMSARKDIRTYFRNGLIAVSDLYDQSIELLLEMGLYTRSPYISYPQETDFVDSKKYLSGFNLFSKQRPVNAIEISHLHMNIQTNLIGLKLALSFAQISPRKEIQKYMLRGKEISEKHVKIFSSALSENNVQVPMSSDIALTDSTVSPFSDKLIMFHFTLLGTAGIGNYATAAAASQRSDLVINYERLSLEIAQYAKDGATIMIDNNWLEQPPGILDKETLVKKKQEGTN